MYVCVCVHAMIFSPLQWTSHTHYTHGNSIWFVWWCECVRVCILILSLRLCACELVSVPMHIMYTCLCMCACHWYSHAGFKLNAYMHMHVCDFVFCVWCRSFMFSSKPIQLHLSGNEKNGSRHIDTHTHTVYAECMYGYECVCACVHVSELIGNYTGKAE